MQPQQLVQLVQLTQKAKQRIPAELQGPTYYSENDVWLYEQSEHPNMCEECAGYNLETFTGTQLRSEFKWHEIIDINFIYPKVHPHCFLKGTKILTAHGYETIEKIKVGDYVYTHTGKLQRVIKTHKNKYEGDIHQIADVFCTPEHPFLTVKGWVPADKLGSVTNQILNLSPMSFEADNSPALFSEVSCFSFVLPQFSWGGMPVSTVNFNSDLMLWNGKVNIENINGVKRNYVKVSPFKAFKKHFFNIRQLTMRLNRNRMINLIRVGFVSASNVLVGFKRQLFSLFRSSVFVPYSFSFLKSSDVNTVNYQVASNNTSVNIEGFGDQVFSFASNVSSDNFFNGNFNSVGSPFTHTTVTLNHNYTKRFKGYVYNLSVENDESYCVGKHNLIVHNCFCGLVRLYPVEEATTPEGKQAYVLPAKTSELSEQGINALMGMSDKDFEGAINAMLFIGYITSSLARLLRDKKKQQKQEDK